MDRCMDGIRDDGFRLVCKWQVSCLEQFETHVSDGD
jgi:hypothetical protein